jgi:hypothetical protein
MLTTRRMPLCLGILLAYSLGFSSTACWADTPESYNQSSAKVHAGNEDSSSNTTESVGSSGRENEASSFRETQAETESSSENGGGFWQPTGRRRPNTAHPSGLPPYLAPAPKSDYVKSGSQTSDYVKGNPQQSDFVKGSDTAPTDYVKSPSTPSDYVKSTIQSSDYTTSPSAQSNYAGGSSK